MGSGAQGVLLASSLVSWIVHVGLWLGLLVVAMTVVRRHRPDALRFILWASLLGLLQGLVGPGLGTLLSQTRALGLDSGSLLMGQAVLGFTGALLHGAVFILLLKGIVRLARPAKALPPAGEPTDEAE